MSNGYLCDNCGDLCGGKPALELVGTLQGPIEKKLKSDGGSGDYCYTCAVKIFPSIRWSKE